MSKATIKAIQAFIDEKYPEMGITFYKGKGYFYFMGDTYVTQNIDSIYVPHLNCAELEWWLAVVEASINDAIRQESLS